MRAFNEWLAVKMSDAFSTMACFWAFTALALLPFVWPRSMAVVQFISSGVLQLVALPLLAVAVRVINDKADRHTSQIADLHAKHDRLHALVNADTDTRG